MRAAAIVLDLDDTLYDSTGRLLPHADRRAAAALAASGLRAPTDAVLSRIAALRAAGCRTIFEEIVREHGGDLAWAAAAASAWDTFDPPPMRLDDDVAAALDELARIAPLALLTAGDPETQRAKIERLGIGPRFVACRIVDRRGSAGKTEALAELLGELGAARERTLVAGDRPDADVRAANRNGCVAVLVRSEGGEHAGVRPESPDDVPWRTIRHVRELPAVVRERFPG